MALWKVGTDLDGGLISAGNIEVKPVGNWKSTYVIACDSRAEFNNDTDFRDGGAEGLLTFHEFTTDMDGDNIQGELTFSASTPAGEGPGFFTGSAMLVIDSNSNGTPDIHHFTENNDLPADQYDTFYTSDETIPASVINSTAKKWVAVPVGDMQVVDVNQIAVPDLDPPEVVGWDAAKKKTLTVTVNLNQVRN